MTQNMQTLMSDTGLKYMELSYHVIKFPMKNWTT